MVTAMGRWSFFYLRRWPLLFATPIVFSGLRPSSPAMVPSSVFSLDQLTDLSLDSCELDINLAFGRLPRLKSLSLTEVTIYKETFPHPDLNGFSSLTSLSLTDVDIYRETFMHLISASPLLKHLICLKLWDLETRAECLGFDIIEVFKFLPAIEHLRMHCSNFTVFKHSIQAAVSNTLVHLKSLWMSDMQLDCLYFFIISSPKLEKIEMGYEDGPTNYIISLDDYSDIWLERLHELKFIFFTNSKLELEFVKLILAKSPTLKKVDTTF